MAHAVNAVHSHPKHTHARRASSHCNMRLYYEAVNYCARSDGMPVHVDAPIYTHIQTHKINTTRSVIIWTRGGGGGGDSSSGGGITAINGQECNGNAALVAA